MNKPYRADTGKANRLHAARRAAGFRSAREAATAFGWPVKTYQAHETASLHFDEAAEKRYATAFRVRLAWLRRNEGEGPPVDEARRARFSVRQTQALPNVTGQAGRLRAARRLAGYGSVAAAAAATGVNRTTVAAHEAGQNGIPRDAALLYGRAYAVEPEWLLSGVQPSGLLLPAGALAEILEAHDLSQRKFLARFAHLVRRTPPLFRRTELQGAEPEASGPEGIEGEPVREFSPRSLFLKLVGDAGGLSSATWRFPKGYLSQLFACDPSMAVFVTVPDHVPGVEPGGRLLIDTGAVDSTAFAHVAVVTEDDHLHLVPLPSGRSSLESLGEGERIAGVVRAYLGPPPSRKS